MCKLTARARLNEAREQYLMAKHYNGMIRNRDPLKGLWLSKCAMAKRRLRYCCNALHSALNWVDSDITKLRA
jgi:hypothetical protein